MDMQDFKDISNIYNEKTFKKQLVLQGIFLSYVVLSIPILGLFSEITLMNNYFFNIQRTYAVIIWISISSLLVIIWFIISSILEKREIFIPWKYYRLTRYRVCYIIAFYIISILFSKSKNSFYPILIYTLLYIPIEIYSDYIEFITFRKKMDKIRHQKQTINE